MPEPTKDEEGLSEVGFLHRLFGWKGIWNHWVILLSGIASVILGVFGEVKDSLVAWLPEWLAAIIKRFPPSWPFWTAAITCMLVAAFRAAYLLYKRADDKRHAREDDLLEATVMKVLLHDRIVDNGHGAFSVIVECFHGGSAPNCGVGLQHSNPPIMDYQVALRCDGDRHLNAGEQRLFNVARINPETGEPELIGAQGAIKLKRTKYTLTLRAHAANTPAWQEKDYALDVTGREIVLYPVLDSDPERYVPRMVIPPEFEPQ